MTTKFTLFASCLNTLMGPPVESEAGGDIEWVPKEGAADRGTVVRCWDGKEVPAIKHAGLNGKCVTFQVYVGYGYVELFTTTPTEGTSPEELAKHVRENGLQTL